MTQLITASAEPRTESILSELLHRKALTPQQASDLAGIPLGDLNKLMAGNASGIRFSTLAALCSTLQCAPHDILRVQARPQRTPAVKALLRRAITYQSSALSKMALLVSAILGVWFLVAVVSRVNPVDFYVYHYASSLAWAGENIYSGNIRGLDMPPEGLPFTYTPFAALLLAPVSLFPAPAAYLVWSVGSALLMGVVLRQFLPPEYQDRPLIVGSLGLAASATIVMASHIIFGQINVFLMALVLFDVCRPRSKGSGRRIPPGILVGVAAAVKLTPALFIVYFFLSRQKSAAWRSLLAAGGATVLAWVIYPEMSWDFLTRVLWSLSDRVSLDGFFATSGNNSIQGALAALGDWTSFPAALLAIAVAVLGLYGASACYRRGEAAQAAIIVGLAACLVSPVSWTHHWVYLLPGLVILWKQGGRKTRTFCYSAAAVLIATGPNLGDAILSLDQPFLLPLAIILRESLLLIAVVSAGLLTMGTAPNRLSHR